MPCKLKFSTLRLENLKIRKVRTPLHLHKTTHFQNGSPSINNESHNPYQATNSLHFPNYTLIPSPQPLISNPPPLPYRNSDPHPCRSHNTIRALMASPTIFTHPTHPMPRHLRHSHLLPTNLRSQTRRQGVWTLAVRRAGWNGGVRFC